MSCRTWRGSSTQTLTAAMQPGAVTSAPWTVKLRHGRSRSPCAMPRPRSMSASSRQAPQVCPMLGNLHHPQLAAGAASRTPSQFREQVYTLVGEWQLVKEMCGRVDGKNSDKFTTSTVLLKRRHRCLVRKCRCHEAGSRGLPLVGAEHLRIHPGQPQQRCGHARLRPGAAGVRCGRPHHANRLTWCVFAAMLT